MNQQKWERDVLNRQRNIVFPDTNLNEGRFYRNIVYDNAVFSRGQKVSLVVVPIYLLMVITMAFVSLISEADAGNGLYPRDLGGYFGVFFVSLISLLFSIFVAVKGLFPVKRKRIVRGGYRSKRSKEHWYGNHRSGGRTSTAGLRRKA
jgi:hypothetical protein